MHPYLWRRWEAIPQLPVSHPLSPPPPPLSSHVEKLIWTHPKQEALRNKPPLPTRRQGTASRHGVGGDDGRFLVKHLRVVDLQELLASPSAAVLWLVGWR